VVDAQLQRQPQNIKHAIDTFDHDVEKPQAKSHVLVDQVGKTQHRKADHKAQLDMVAQHGQNNARIKDLGRRQIFVVGL